MNNVKVYRHIKPNGETFYIGIGVNNRPSDKRQRNRFWNHIVKKYPNYEVQVLKSDLNWEDACELEQILISYYGRRDLGTGTLVNLTNGGEGSFGFKHTEEAKQKISESNKNRIITKETKQKMSKAHKGKNSAWYGKTHSEETKKKMSESSKGKIFTKKHIENLSKGHSKRLVKIDGSEWMTVKEMALFLGYKQTTTIKSYLTNKVPNMKLKELNLIQKTINNNK